ncbi:MAG TPA: diguanylate cyclase [Solirubrobacteraceae bacterium]|nr:diguanylate cyclase [Solirubrobacteraceae bacterium]
MSFRNRLALFFVLIVIVPMLAVTFLLFRLIDDSETGQAEAAIAQQHTFASELFQEQRALAKEAAEDIGADRVFATSLQNGDHERARRRALQLLGSRGIERIVFSKEGRSVVRVGDRRAIAPYVQKVVSRDGREVGSLGVSVIDGATYVRRVETLTGGHAVVLNGDTVLGSSIRGIDPGRLPDEQGNTLTVGETEYLVQNFGDRGSFPAQQIRVFTLVPPTAYKDSTSGERMTAAAILLGFFLIAIACAFLVSRTLQQQIAAFLVAARRLAGGDFSSKVPTVGHDEFAELGEEFNKMSRELERRLAELTQERGRVQDSMRRLGEAVGANLDRDALLALVLRTAVDGVGADAGRACVRISGNGTLQERSRVGSMGGLEQAVAAVEADALQSGSVREATLGSANAIAHPLRGADGRDQVVGVVSVGRNGRPFTPSDRELFTYLAGQAARSMENVDLHETAARESVTDDLTGLSNRRAFDDALSSEVERTRRLGGDLGLVLIDLDNFKRVNDTYGHPQGDLVLREVARVLQASSREIDQPARYGGEELAVVLPGTDLEGAYNRAERIREEIERLRIPRLDGTGVLNVTTSCGVASMRGTAADGTALVQAADTALYEAKHSGKNTSVRAR